MKKQNKHGTIEDILVCGGCEYWDEDQFHPVGASEYEGFPCMNPLVRNAGKNCDGEFYTDPNDIYDDVEEVFQTKYVRDNLYE